MARKNVLAPVKIATAQSLASSFNSSPTIISYEDNIVYNIKVTTSDSTGTFKLQCSPDYVPSAAPTQSSSAATGTWYDLAMSGDNLGVPTVNAANDSMTLKLTQVSFKAIRLAYTSSVAGTGTCDIYITANTVGA